MTTGFLATTSGASGGAAALSAVVHAALLIAAVIGVHGANTTTTGEAAAFDTIAVEAPEAPMEAPKVPEIARADDHPQRVAPAARVREARRDLRAEGESANDTVSAPPVATASDPAPAHFSMKMSATDPPAPTTTVSAPAHEPSPAAAPASRGAARAKITYRVAPTYTAEALAAGIEGDVGLEVVVSEKGTFVSARVTRGLGYGLDEAALAAVARWRFEPSRDADGHAVAIRMECPMQFRLE